MWLNNHLKTDIGYFWLMIIVLHIMQTMFCSLRSLRLCIQEQGENFLLLSIRKFYKHAGKPTCSVSAQSYGPQLV